MTTSIVTAPMQRKADALVDLLGTFSRGRSKVTGAEFYVVPASNRMTAHWTAARRLGLHLPRLPAPRHLHPQHRRQDAPATAVARRSPAWPTSRAAARRPGAPNDREPHERFCLRHVTVDAF